MQIGVPQVAIQHVGIQDIDIGQVKIGPITVDDLVINNVDVGVTDAQGALQNVAITITLHFSVDWAVHVGLPDWIPDIDVGDSYDLGALQFGPLGIGNVGLPALNDIHLHIPTLTGRGVSVEAEPITLHVSNVAAEEISAINLIAPTEGFTLAGMAVTSVQVAGVAIPATHVESTSIRQVRGDALNVPALALRNLQLPSLRIPNISTSAGLDIPADLATQSIGFDAGIVRVAIHVTPSALMHVDHLEITNANANASVEQVVVHNVTLPYEVLNLTLSDIGVDTIAVPAVNVS